MIAFFSQTQISRCYTCSLSNNVAIRSAKETSKDQNDGFSQLLMFPSQWYHKLNSESWRKFLSKWKWQKFMPPVFIGIIQTLRIHTSCIACSLLVAMLSPRRLLSRLLPQAFPGDPPTIQSMESRPLPTSTSPGTSAETPESRCTQAAQRLHTSSASSKSQAISRPGCTGLDISQKVLEGGKSQTKWKRIKLQLSGWVRRSKGSWKREKDLSWTEKATRRIYSFEQRHTHTYCFTLLTFD